MITGMVIGFVTWAAIFITCILYAAFTKKHFINVWFLFALLLGFLFAGFFYGWVMK